MDLTDAQKQLVGQWVKEGCGLSEIQKKLSSELGIPMTYMDVRFLVIDLGLNVKDKKVAAVPAGNRKAPPSADEEEIEAAEPASGLGLSKVSVDVDRIVKPGSVVSGTVKFSDGVSATWALDQFGRLALDAGKRRYTPSEQDVQAFQLELRKVLERKGF